MRCLVPLLSLLAAAALAAPAGAVQRDIPAHLYETGVPDGVVEHGVVELQISGVPRGYESHLKTEYWALDDRFRSRTTDVATGAVVVESVVTPRGSYLFTARDGRVSMREGARTTPPYPGWTARYNRELVERGVLVQVGERTVAGFPGVVYAVRAERKTSDPDAGEEQWVTDDTSSETELVFERGTFAPLVRTTRKADNGGHGDFEQREELLLRERRPETSAVARPLSTRSTSRVVQAWKKRARAAQTRGGGRRAAR
jgi:hypothetical protein